MIGRTVSKHKHKSSESQVRVKKKLPKYGQFWDDKGNRYRKVLDEGWGDPRSNNIKRPELIRCVASLKPSKWVMIRVKSGSGEKTAWNRQRQRLGVEWLTVKAKEKGMVRTYCFVYEPCHKSKLVKYSDIIPRLLQGSRLQQTLDRLLHHKLHPNQKGICRFEVSAFLRGELHLARVKLLWGDVMYNPIRLAICIRADNVFHLGKLELTDIFPLLTKAGLSEDARLKTLKKFRELKLAEYSLKMVHTGSPEAGAKSDEAEMYRGKKAFEVTLGKDSAYSEILRPYDDDSWGTIPDK